MRIFISHSALDADLAEALARLCMSALHLRSSDIRCTSVDGFRLPLGIDTNSALRDEVFGCDILLALLTPRSVASTYVLFELGARWGAGKPMASLMARGMRPSLLPGPQASFNALSTGSMAQIHQMITDLASILQTLPEPPAAYESAALALQTLSLGSRAPASPVEGTGGRVTNRNSLLAGYGLGNAIALLPRGRAEDEDEVEDSAMLGEVTRALAALPVDQVLVAELDRYGSRPIPEDAGKEDLLRFFGLINALRSSAHEVLHGRPQSWFTLGETLATIGVLAVSGDLMQARSPVVTLGAILDLMELPASLDEPLRLLQQRAMQEASCSATENRQRPSSTEIYLDCQTCMRMLWDVADIAD